MYLSSLTNRKVWHLTDGMLTTSPTKSTFILPTPIKNCSLSLLCSMRWLDVFKMIEGVTQNMAPNQIEKRKDSAHIEGHVRILIALISIFPIG